MTPFGIRKKMMVCFLGVFGIWLLGSFWFVQQIPNKQSEFSENAADAIVVLTGGGGRLEYGLQLLAENKAKTLFISGVGEGVTVADILHLFPQGLDKELAGQIKLGHLAKNTIGNAEETADWLADKKYKSILLVTSDYHIPRAMLEFSEALPDITIIPAPVLSNAGLSDGLLAIGEELPFVEYNKYLASKLRHIFVHVIGG